MPQLPGVLYFYQPLPMQLSETEPLWRIMSRARLERIDEPNTSPLVYACVIRALSKAIPTEAFTTDEIKSWLEIEADRAERGHGGTQVLF